MLEELKTLREAGIDYRGRIHLSDRAHIVFDFHQHVDAYNEKQLAGKKIGTTLKGIGPAYSNKTMRNGLRVGDLRDMEYFELRLRGLAAQVGTMYAAIGGRTIFAFEHNIIMYTTNIREADSESVFYYSCNHLINLRYN